MKRLPDFIWSKGQYAFNDLESATAVETVAKLYAAINSLIEEYNNAFNTITSDIEQFEGESKEELECFKSCLIKTMNDFIDSANMIHDQQTTEVEKSIAYMTENISQLASDVLNDLLNEGSVVVNMKYDEDSKELAIVGSIVDDGSLTEITYNPDDEQLIHND